MKNPVYYKTKKVYDENQKILISVNEAIAESGNRDAQMITDKNSEEGMMKNKLFILFLFILSFSSLAFAGEVTVKTESPNEREETITNIYFENNKEVAREKVIFDSKDTEAINPQFEVTGRISDGIVKIFYPNGLVSLMGSGFINALGGDIKREGFYKDGALIQEESFKNNKRNGISKVYYPDGKIANEMNYQDNKLDGEWKTYGPDGTLAMEGSYSNDKQEGIWKEYNGDIVEYQNYKDGKLDGPQKTYKNGKLVREINYKDNKAEGTWWELYDDGGKVVREFKDDKNISEKAYYPDGKLKRDQEIYEGEQNYKIKRFYPTGELESEEIYENNKLKSKNNYDKSGNVIEKKNEEKIPALSIHRTTASYASTTTSTTNVAVLHRTVRNCSDHSPIGEPQAVKIKNDGTVRYSSYTCRSRYQEQCIDDGSFDNYFDEWCEDKDGKRLEIK